MIGVQRDCIKKTKLTHYINDAKQETTSSCEQSNVHPK